MSLKTVQEPSRFSNKRLFLISFKKNQVLKDIHSLVNKFLSNNREKKVLNVMDFEVYPFWQNVTRNINC